MEGEKALNERLGGDWCVGADGGMLGSCWGPLNRIYFPEKLETGRGVRLDIFLYQPPSFESEVSCVFSSTFAFVLQTLLPKSEKSLRVLVLSWHRVS